MLPTLGRRTGGLHLDRPLTLLNEIDRILGRSWENTGEYTGTGAYPVDIREDQDAVYVEAELPGFRKDQIEVNLEKGILRIVAQRDDKEKSGAVHLSERRFTQIARAFTLPTDVDETNVEAKLTEGVLFLKLHKREEVKPHRIAVK